MTKGKTNKLTKLTNRDIGGIGGTNIKQHIQDCFAEGIIFTV